MLKTQKLKLLESKLKKYEAGNVALTSKELDQLYKNIREATDSLKANCKHNHCEHYKIHEVDSGYGCDRDYYYHGIKCNDCDKRLLRGREYDIFFNAFNKDVIRKGTIKQLAEIWINYFSDESWEKAGVKIIRQTHQTVKII